MNNPDPVEFPSRCLQHLAFIFKAHTQLLCILERTSNSLLASIALHALQQLDRTHFEGIFEDRLSGSIVNAVIVPAYLTTHHRDEQHFIDWSCPYNEFDLGGSTQAIEELQHHIGPLFGLARMFILNADPRIQKDVFRKAIAGLEAQWFRQGRYISVMPWLSTPEGKEILSCALSRILRAECECSG